LIALIKLLLFLRAKASTLNDLEDHWQPLRSAILATAGLLVYCVCRSVSLRNIQRLFSPARYKSRRSI